ncbi:hypothetical protein B0H66DRAFT_529041 [Apodospora peruviana]|uniref:WW domain-containing protein n=1 Tax=Apodospora peruviana TaxID=516989 RepID=A0AAE0IH94_9PEZI|nr:hypothetical protein B0H66DRAFT_529041 [Apodospora peruviana]
MASPLSLGDLMAVGKAAWELYEACQSAPDHVRELGTLCSNIALTINSCRPNDPTALLRRAFLSKEQAEALELLVNRIEDSMQAIRQILGKYEGLDVPSLRNIGRRAVFGVFTVEDCNDLRRTMMGQVQTLTLLLQGQNISFQGMAVALLSELVADKRRANKARAGSEPDAVALIDDQTWKELVKDLKLRNKDADSELLLLGESAAIREDVVKRAEKEASAVDHDTSKKAEAELDAKVSKITNVAALAKMDEYSPIDGRDLSWSWFRGPVFPGSCTPVSVGEAVNDNSLLNSPSFQLPTVERQYSAEDKWLCPFLEGWMLNRTKAMRAGRMEDAFYFSYNNLTAGGTRPPQTSRLYFWRSPLLPSDHDIKTHFQTKGMTDASKYPYGLTRIPPTDDNLQLWPSFNWNPWGRFVAYYGPGYVPTRCIGRNPWWGPLDPSDEVTALFIRAHYGNWGLPSHYTDETIDQSLPQGWVWKKDVSGFGRHIYTYLGDLNGKRLDTTVHPSRFFSEEDPFPVHLPPGWHRRLDRDGSLFFVDDNTRSATRVDPRFNRNINQETGLPVGWTCTLVEDIPFHDLQSISSSSNNNNNNNANANNNDSEATSFPNKKRPTTTDNDKAAAAKPLIPYYHTRIGKTIIGTKWPTSIITKSLDFKDFLNTVPIKGKPLSLLKPDTKEAKKPHVSHLISMIRRDTLPPPSPELRKRYDAIFSEIAAKSPPEYQLGKYRIAHAQVEARCRDSGLPLAVYTPILMEADANSDGVFTPPEFAVVLHTMQVALRQWHDNQPPVSLVPAHLLPGYDRLFEKFKEEGSLDISEEKAVAAAESVYCDEGMRKFAKDMWSKKAAKSPALGLGGESMLDIVQFSEGMNELSVEMARRKDLARIGGDEVVEMPRTGPDGLRSAMTQPVDHYPNPHDRAGVAGEAQPTAMPMAGEKHGLAIAQGVSGDDPASTVGTSTSSDLKVEEVPEQGG